MANITIGPPGTGALPTANSIDGVQDYIPIYTASATSTQAINRNTYLGLASGPVGLTDNQTLTNKTLTSPTIGSPTLSGTLSGTYTIGGTPTFPASVATLTGTQTLTNKTLTSPTINSPTITNASLTADSISGFTTANNGTIYGIAVTAGAITGANTIGTGTIVQNGVAASQLATNAITLGYAQITTNFSTASTSVVQITGLSVSVTIPSGGRKVKVTFICRSVLNTGVNFSVISLWDGTVGTGTQIGEMSMESAIANSEVPGVCMAIVTPSAGSKTYNAGIKANANTATVTASSAGPTFILVEMI